MVFQSENFSQHNTIGINCTSADFIDIQQVEGNYVVKDCVEVQTKMIPTLLSFLLLTLVLEYASDFEIAQNSNHSVSCSFLLKKTITRQNLKIAQFFQFENSEIALNSNHFRLEFNFFSTFELFQNFRTEKVSYLKNLTRDRFFEQK